MYGVAPNPLPSLPAPADNAAMEAGPLIASAYRTRPFMRHRDSRFQRSIRQPGNAFFSFAKPALRGWKDQT
jgi:hypothetical protein